MKTRHGARPVVWLVAAGVLLATAVSAGAAPTWLAPDNLSATGQNNQLQQVASDPVGDAVAVWARTTGATTTLVQAAVHPAGGAWSAPDDLAPSGLSPDPDVGMDGAGTAVAVWTRTVAAPFVIQWASRPKAGSWSSPRDLSAAGQASFAPKIAVNAAGAAVAVWSRVAGAVHAIQAAVRPPGGDWSAPQDLSDLSFDSFGARVGIDAAGNAVAVFQSNTDGPRYIVQAAVHPAGGAWSKPDDLSAKGQEARDAEVAVNAAGTAVAVWKRSNGMHTIVQAALRPVASGVWQPPDNLSAVGQNADEPDVGIDSAGNAVAVWGRFDGTNRIVQGAARPAGGGWSSSQNLSATGQSATNARVVVAAAGDAVAAWQRSNGSNPIVQAAARPAGGSFAAPQNLSALGGDALEPELAVNAAGDTVAVWRRFNGSNYIVQAAGGDAAGPVLAGLAAPARGITGKRLSFSVSPVDAWSALAGPRSGRSATARAPAASASDTRTRVAAGSRSRSPRPTRSATSPRPRGS